MIGPSANLQILFERAADYVDRILKGAKPAEMPVHLATKFRAYHQREDHDWDGPSRSANAYFARRRSD